MFKRVIWMGMGAAAGSAGTVWAQRKVKERIELMSETISPAGVTRAAIDRAGVLGETVRAAVEEGRTAARVTDSELRAGLDERLATQSRTARRRGRDYARQPAHTAEVTPLRSARSAGSRSR